MTRAVMVWGVFTILAAGAWCDDQGTGAQNAASGVTERMFFPQNSVRGFLDFQVAPPHNEVDMGLCAVATSNPYPLTNCSAYARYVWSGYLEAQPIGRGPLRHMFVFVEPKVYGGNNVPQVRYSASASLIMSELNVGFGFELPRNFELRATSHEVYLLGRYSGPGGAANLRSDGPYGANFTAGVRWYFGAWDHSTMRAR